tara:strand:- start:445 stop:546 length:102 start_codon:yes stop_codon:yes gene_type:complete
MIKRMFKEIMEVIREVRDELKLIRRMLEGEENE